MFLVYPGRPVRDDELCKELSAVRNPDLVKFDLLLDTDMQAKITVKYMSKSIPSYHTPSQSSKKGGVRNQRASSSPSLKTKRSGEKSSRANATGVDRVTTCSLPANCYQALHATCAISQVIFLLYAPNPPMQECSKILLPLHNRSLIQPSSTCRTGLLGPSNPIILRLLLTLCILLCLHRSFLCD